MQLFLLSPDACRFLALPDLPEGQIGRASCRERV